MAVERVQLLSVPGFPSIPLDLYTGLQLPGPLQNISFSRLKNARSFTLGIPAPTSRCESQPSS